MPVLAALAQQPAGRSVYVLPMSGGLDQFLAAQLTHGHIMQVVSDPKIADTILTDRLGDSLELALEKYHPRDDDEDTSADAPRHAFQSSGAKGTVFLVDAKSRQVIWSDFEKPPSTKTAAHLNKQALRIVKRLQAPVSK